MQIHTLSDARASRFAAKELQSYLIRMGCPTLTYSLDVTDLTAYGLPAVADPALDDQYYIEVTAEKQILLGNNPRALLLGVYRYLTLIGCRFLRPGKEFEVVPVHTCVSDFYAKEAHTAALRHRGACLEGADSIENLFDFLDWSPKVGFNSFFFQFKYPHTFLDRWFSHQQNPNLKPVPWTMEDSKRLFPYLNEAMLDRGLLQHRVGHGWTSEVLGCSATGWDTEEIAFSDETRQLIAQVNGKRELFYGVPTNTNLCLSNPEARERFADKVIAYVQENPATDYLHIWLADAVNNACECENCRKLRPSDHYVALLNRIDERLTEIGSSTRLVMLLYVDLLWAPVQNKIQNGDRFVLMFAPITRTFEQSYSEHGPLKPAPEFQLNHLKFPRDIETNLSFLKDWQKVGARDSFVYDYPLGRAHYGDPSYVGISRIIYNDLQYHRQLGLNGINSCQELRACFPNALPNYVMARTSLDLTPSFEEIAKEYYEAAYGPTGLQLLPLMDELSSLFSSNYVLQNGPRVNPELCAKAKQVPAVLERIQTLMENRQPSQYAAQEHMWHEIGFFIEYTRLFARITELATGDEPDAALDVFENEFKPLIQKHELVDQSGLDVFRVSSILAGAFRKERP